LQSEAISKIFIVDCQHKDRLDPIVQKLIDNGTPYTIFDHHQNDPAGLSAKAQKDSIIESVGACTTLIVEKIENSKIKLSPFESTLLALGIYEDTGCLTYNSTTNRDADALAFLLRQGADLPVINEYMRPKLTDAQQTLLQNMVTGARLIYVSGNRIILCAANSSNYIDGLAVLTRKLSDIESADAVFAAVQMRDRIYLVGRSDTSTIDVRQIVRLYGGDGHMGAGSAVVKKGSDPKAILKSIEKFLTETIEPELTAKRIMSMPIKMILPSVSMDEAGKIMIRYNLDGLLVAEEGRVLGVIGKRDVDQATHHKLGHAPVSGFMSRPVITISPDTTFSDVQTIMVRNNIGRLPVMSESDELLGVVSRADILKILFDKSSKTGTKKSSLTIAGQLNSAADENTNMSLERDHSQILAFNERFLAQEPDTISLFRQIGKLAAQLNMAAYAVGGLVRDMMLGLKQFDLDFVVEATSDPKTASAIILAEELVALQPNKFQLVSKHDRFQTATVKYLSKPERFIDLSTARQEFYEHPAALPTVEPSLLKEDIFRRDFTINTLAVALNPDQFGILVDYFHGLEDLQAGIIRVLHQFSFVEDPTRILRAARFASRLGFKLDDNTAELARHAIAMGIFDNLASVRMKEELRLILNSANRLKALELLSNLGAKLRYLDEELAYGTTERKLLRRGEQMLKHYAVDTERSWLVYLALLLSSLPLERLVRILGRLHLANEDREMIIRGLTLDQQMIKLKRTTKNSEIYKIFKNTSDISLAIAATLSNPGSSGRRVIKLYWEELKNIQPELSGSDLLQMGLSEGPDIGRSLDDLLRAKLDGIVRNRKEEIDFIRHYSITHVL